MVDYTERAARLRVLWNRGRNIYTSFYTELDAARSDVGDERFADWCFYELRISLSILNDTARVLKSADAAVVRREWAQAREVEKAARKTVAEENKREREAAHQRRQAAQARAAEERKAAEADNKRAEDNRKQRDRRARLAAEKKKQTLTNPDLVRLLGECEGIEATSRVELGRRYAEMKDIVQRQQAGRNVHGHFWTWGGWCEVNIERSRKDIWRCIEEFVASCHNSQSENVVQFQKTVA
jgi:hypothetical protein